MAPGYRGRCRLILGVDNQSCTPATPIRSTSATPVPRDGKQKRLVNRTPTQALTTLCVVVAVVHSSQIPVVPRLKTWAADFSRLPLTRPHPADISSYRHFEDARLCLTTCDPSSARAQPHGYVLALWRASSAFPLRVRQARNDLAFNMCLLCFASAIDAGHSQTTCAATAASTRRYRRTAHEHRAASTDV